MVRSTIGYHVCFVFVAVEAAVAVFYFIVNVDLNWSPVVSFFVSVWLFMILFL